MAERKNTIQRNKTGQQLIKETLSVVATTALCVGLGVILVVLGCTGVVSETNSSRTFMLVAGIVVIILSLVIVPPAFYLTNWQYFNKAKFERKCDELMQFEEKTLNEAEQRLSPLRANLEAMGLELHVSLLWYDFLAHYGGEQYFFQNRIDFFNGYACLLQCAITRSGEDPMNDELNNFDRVYTITSISGAVARFHTYTLQEDYYEDFENCCKKIQETGYENFLNSLVEIR